MCIHVSSYSRRRAIDVGEVTVIVYAQQLQGRRYILDHSGTKGSLRLLKQWSHSTSSHPLQTIVRDIYIHAPQYREAARTLEELFKEGDQCFLLAPTFYGEQAEVRVTLV